MKELCQYHLVELKGKIRMIGLDNHLLETALLFRSHRSAKGIEIIEPGRDL